MHSNKEYRCVITEKNPPQYNTVKVVNNILISARTYNMGGEGVGIYLGM